VDYAYKNFCESVTGAGTSPTATTTNAHAAATTTQTIAATATSPTPTKSGAAGLRGVGRSISAVGIVLGVFVYLMA
jgi:hypothetical protein